MKVQSIVSPRVLAAKTISWTRAADDETRECYVAALTELDSLSLDDFDRYERWTNQLDEAAIGLTMAILMYEIFMDA